MFKRLDCLILSEPEKFNQTTGKTLRPCLLKFYRKIVNRKEDTMERFAFKLKRTVLNR